MKPLIDNEEIIKNVAIFGIVATQIMNLSSLPSIVEIVRAKSTLMYPTFPFSVSIVASTTSIIYSILSDQIIVGLSSIMTVGQCVVYESVHLYFSTTRWRIVRELVGLAVIVACAMGIGPLFRCPFTSNCSPFVTEWFGIVMAVISCVRYGAQASTFGRVIKSRNAASISPYMTGGALFGSLAWVVYATLAGDPYYLASGLAGTLSSLGQIVLLVKFPRRMDPPPTSTTKIVNENCETELTNLPSDKSFEPKPVSVGAASTTHPDDVSLE